MRAVWFIRAILVAVVIAIAPGEALARKLFIQSLNVSPSCVSVSSEALRSRIAQQIPRDVLALRGLGYEDLSAYEAVTTWNPQQFTVRQNANVTNRLRQLDMRYMLWLELSCLPSGGTSRFSLTGRLTDLDAMDTILSCPNAQAGTQDGRRVCNVNGQVFDAVSYTSVDLRSFDDFVPAVRELLARLLHIPEVSVATSTRVFHPSEPIDVAFFVRRNDGTEEGFNGQPAMVRGYGMRQDLVQIPADLYAEVCHAPGRRWDQLACTGGFSQGRCDPADRIPFEVRSLIGREIPATAVDPTRGAREGGDRVTVRAPSHEAFYVLRAEAIARESGGEVRSAPAFACLHVRERRVYLGFAARLGTVLSTVPSDPRDRTYPAPSIVGVPYGIDFSFARYVASSRRPFVPLATVHAIAGVTQIQGQTPCNHHSEPLCQQQYTTSEFLARRHLSFSTSIEARAQLRTDLFRIGPVAPVIVAELGVGMEILSSDPSFAGDGVGGLWLSGAGGGLTLSLGRASNIGTRISLLAQYQGRGRMSQRSRAGTGTTSWVEAAGVPEFIHMLWFSLGVEFGLVDDRDEGGSR